MGSSPYGADARRPFTNTPIVPRYYLAFPFYRLNKDEDLSWVIFPNNLWV
jgi:hypothetical protein